jgi:hypothetical protein
MAYNKPSVLPAWAETAANPADIVQPTNAEIQAGWPNTGVPPSRQRFNWILSFCANAVRYFCQRGLPDYDSAETYGLNARCIGDDGNTYVSLQSNNTNHAPSSNPLWWARWGFTLSQLNASQLTQANVGVDDDSTKVANTHFVKAAISAALTTLGGYATQAWVAAQNFATQTWVQAWATAGFAVGFGANGYIKLPNWLGGFILQWGQGYWSSSDQTVSWPIAFPNACCTAYASCYWGYSSNNTTSAFAITGYGTTYISVHPNRRTDSTPSGGIPFVIGIGY